MGGIVFRVQDLNNHIHLQINSGGYNLLKCVGGTFTPLDIEGSMTNPVGTPMDLKVTCSGDTINCYLNGVLTLTATESAFNTETTIGLVDWSGTGFGGGCLFDDFTMTP